MQHPVCYRHRTDVHFGRGRNPGAQNRIELRASYILAFAGMTIMTAYSLRVSRTNPTTTYMSPITGANSLAASTRPSPLFP